MKIDDEDIRPIAPKKERSKGHGIIVIAIGVFLGSIAAKVVEGALLYYSTQYQFETLRHSIKQGEFKIDTPR